MNPIVFGGEPEVAKQLLKGASAQPANRFSYVVGNPETVTDPSGRRVDLETTGADFYDMGQAPDGLLVGNPDILYWPGANPKGKTYSVGFRYSGKSLDVLISNLQGQLDDLKYGNGSDSEADKEIFVDLLTTALGTPFGTPGNLVGLGLGMSISHKLNEVYQAKVDSLSAEITALQQIQSNNGEVIYVDVVVNGHTELQTLPGGISGGRLPFDTENIYSPDGGNPFRSFPGLGFTTEMDAD